MDRGCPRGTGRSRCAAAGCNPLEQWDRGLVGYNTPATSTAQGIKQGGQDPHHTGRLEPGGTPRRSRPSYPADHWSRVVQILSKVGDQTAPAPKSFTSHCLKCRGVARVSEAPICRACCAAQHAATSMPSSNPGSLQMPKNRRINFRRKARRGECTAFVDGSGEMGVLR